MKKIAVILGAFSIGTRPINIANCMSDARGLTGTDLAFIRISETLVVLGYDVHSFTVRSDPETNEHNGVHYHNFEDRHRIVDDEFVAIISINEPNVFEHMATKPYKICYQFLNDFSFVKPGFNDWVDRYVGVCEQHMDYVQSAYPETKGKWSVIPLGCDPDLYEDKRVPGRVIWCSSADRGLHWLLQQWHLIKKAVPEASLRVFYHFNYDNVKHIEPLDRQSHYHVVEMANRVRYIKDALEKLKSLDVEHVGSVSREQMVQEWNAASVFGFSCDTVAFSEGFSVSTLEAHASFTVPVLTTQDCLGSIYRDSGCLITEAPIQDNIKHFTDNMILALTNKEISDLLVVKTREFASNYTWKNTAEKLITIIEQNYINNKE